MHNTLVYDVKAAEWLTDLSFDWRLLGTLYLCDALSLILQHGIQYLEEPLMYTIYPEVAERRGVDPRAVERSMRYAIESAWLRSVPEVLAVYFPEEYPNTGRPTVSMFIRRIGLCAVRDFYNLPA